MVGDLEHWDEADRAHRDRVTSGRAKGRAGAWLVAGCFLTDGIRAWALCLSSSPGLSSVPACPTTGHPVVSPQPDLVRGSTLGHGA